MAVCDIDSHDEQLDDGTFIAWPATVASIPTDINHVILANRGDALTYTSMDGTQFIQFGSAYSATGGWASSNGSFMNSGGTYYYDGPYASILGSRFNGDDDNFVDIEVLTTVDQFQDPRNGEFHHDPRSSPPPIGSEHIRLGVVAGPHIQSSVGGTVAALSVDNAAVTEPPSSGTWAVEVYRHTSVIALSTAQYQASGLGDWEVAVANWNGSGSPPTSPSGAWEQVHRATLAAGTSYTSVDLEQPILDSANYSGALINSVTFSTALGGVVIQWQPIVVNAGSPGTNTTVYLFFRINGTPAT